MQLCRFSSTQEHKYEQVHTLDLRLHSWGGGDNRSAATVAVGTLSHPGSLRGSLFCAVVRGLVQICRNTLNWCKRVVRPQAKPHLWCCFYFSAAPPPNSEFFSVPTNSRRGNVETFSPFLQLRIFLWRDGNVPSMKNIEIYPSCPAATSPDAKEKRWEEEFGDLEALFVVPGTVWKTHLKDGKKE